MSAYVIPAQCYSRALHNVQRVQSEKQAVWNRPALFGVDLCGEQEVRGRIDWVSGESYQESFTIADRRLIFLGHITSSRLSVKLQNKAAVTTELHVCSSDARENLNLASKKDFALSSAALLDLSGAGWSYFFFFCLSPSSANKNVKHILIKLSPDGSIQSLV